VTAEPLPGLGRIDLDVPYELAESGKVGTHCRSCDTPVIWCFTQGSDGRTMLVDAVPDPTGNLKLRVARTGTVYCTVISASERDEFEGMLHKSHFATCRDAAMYRKKR